MLKNLLKVGVFAGLLAFTCNSFAQEETTKEYANVYPQYGFWSNWSLGAEIGWAHQFTNGLSWVHGSNAGWQLIIEKELSPAWSLRLSGGVPGQWGHPTTDANGNAYTCPNQSANGRVYDRFGDLKVGAKLNLCSAVKGYDPERKNEFYVLANTGLGVMYKHEDFGNVSMLMEAGMGFSHKCCEHSTIFVEATINDIADIRNPLAIFRSSKPDVTNFNSFVGFGYMYNFGPTAADLELIAQRKELTQENFDALNDQINKLNKEVATGKQTEQRLQNTINDLEERISRGGRRNNKGEIVFDSQDADSLQNILNSIKNDQMNFYALPFSILYGVDKYKVSADQKDKVAAIARVIKDTENAKFSVIGFCDYTGSDAYNQKLSEKRAEELKRVLVEEYGVDEDRIATGGRGKNSPFGDVKYSINRRCSVYRVIE